MQEDVGGGKRELILQQAMNLFADKGVDAVTVRDIGRACDMTAPNLYAHFKNKDALVAELFVDGYAEYGRLMQEAAGVAGPFRTKLWHIVHLICRLHDQDHARFRFLVMMQHGFLREIARDMDNPVEVVCATVAAAMTAGEIPARDPNVMALAIIGIIVQPATGCLYGRIQGGLVQHADLFVDACWRALS